MKKNRLQSKSLEPFVPTPLTPLKKLSLPLTLNEYYSSFIENVKDCLLFLERFSEEDSNIKNIVEIFKTDKQFKGKIDIDLDLLAFKADVSKGEFRRLINSTLDLLGDEEAMLILRTNKASIISKSVQIALTHDHPDSMQERKAFMEYFGYRLAPKNNQVQVNIDKSTNTTTQQVAISGLPSFSNQMQDSEKIGQSKIQSLINEDNFDIAQENKKAKPKQITKGDDLIPIYYDQEVKEAEFVNLDLENSNENSKETLESEEEND